MFIGIASVDTETCPWLYTQFVSGTFPNRTYGFDSPAGFWKEFAKVPGFVISPVAVDTLTGFKSVPQVVQV